MIGILKQGMAKEGVRIIPKPKAYAGLEGRYAPADSTVAYAGAPGSFAYEAARKAFPDATLTGFESFDDVFDAVLDGRAEMGVVPVENSLAGKVDEVINRIEDERIRVIGYVKIKIFQRLMAPEGTELSGIKKIYSHRKALEQCKKFLDSMEGCRMISYPTTSAAAAMVASIDDKCSAAIASEAAAKLNRLCIIKKEIQDSAENYTEFAVLKAKKAGAHILGMEK